MEHTRSAIRRVIPKVGDSVSSKAAPLLQPVGSMGSLHSRRRSGIHRRNQEGQIARASYLRCAVMHVQLVTNKRRPILTITEDTCGVHDTLMSACDIYRYQVRACQACVFISLRVTRAVDMLKRKLYLPYPTDVLRHCSFARGAHAFSCLVYFLYH